MADAAAGPPTVLGDYRWTTAEYVLRCQQSPELREVLVEGQLDHDVVVDALGRWNVDGINVLISDYVSVAPEDVAAAGHRAGVKGQLLTLAAALDAQVGEEGSDGVIVVVDRDYDGPAGGRARVLVTDGYSIESYAYNEPALERFARFVLRRGGPGTPRPRGSGAAPNGADLFRRVSEAALAVAAARLALASLEKQCTLTSRWVDQVQVDRDGRMTVAHRALLRSALSAASQTAAQDAAEAEFERMHPRVERDRFSLVRGRDFVDLLLRLLRSQWGRKVSGNRFRSETPRTLGALLMLAVDSAALDATPLFQSLRARLAG
jgi:hypothetical protein